MREQTEFGSKLIDKNTSSLKKYQKIVVGSENLLYLFVYEIYHMFLSPLGGALGFVLRKFCCKFLFKKVGASPTIGRNISLRHANNIVLGDNVIIDDNAVLDAKGEGNEGIVIGNNVLIGRNSILSCKGTGKGGNIKIGNNTNIAMFCTLHSETEIVIGNNVLFAAYTYIISGGRHDYARKDIPIIEQPSVFKGIIEIEDDIWIGAKTMIMGSLKISRGSIVGACSLVNKSLPEYSISFGVPAVVKKSR